MNAAIRNALKLLPPEIAACAIRLGIEPIRIEGSGAMRLRIDNKLSITQKAAAIKDFKSILKICGLDLGRITTDTTSTSVWDSSLLMIKRDSLGHVVPLFDKFGVPMKGFVHEQANESSIPHANNKATEPGQTIRTGGTTFWIRSRQG